MPSSNRIQIDAVSLFTRQMKPRRFENVPLLAAVSNRHGFDNSINRCRVNGRCNRVRVNAASDAPVRNLLSSIAGFVPCDRQLQRAPIG